MLRIARKRAPQAKFVTGSLLDYPLPACDAVTSVGECINYSFDPANSRKRLSRFFRRVCHALRPGGIFVFDTAEPGQVPEGKGRRIYGEGEGWAVLVEAHEDRRRRVLIRRITSFRKMGKLYRRTEEVHQLRLYTGAELVSDLEDAGFRTRLRPGYGACRLPPAHVAIVARKI
jgi:SAM-dependent methyltransferase